MKVDKQQAILETLSYRELQKLALGLHIQANLKKSMLCILIRLAQLGKHSEVNRIVQEHRLQREAKTKRLTQVNVDCGGSVMKKKGNRNKNYKENRIIDADHVFIDDHNNNNEYNYGRVQNFNPETDGKMWERSVALSSRKFDNNFPSAPPLVSTTAILPSPSTQSAFFNHGQQSSVGPRRKGELTPVNVNRTQYFPIGNHNRLHPHSISRPPPLIPFSSVHKLSPVHTNTTSTSDTQWTRTTDSLIPLPQPPMLSPVHPNTTSSTDNQWTHTTDSLVPFPQPQPNENNSVCQGQDVAQYDASNNNIWVAKRASHNSDLGSSNNYETINNFMSNFNMMNYNVLKNQFHASLYSYNEMPRVALQSKEHQQYDFHRRQEIFVQKMNCNENNGNEWQHSSYAANNNDSFQDNNLLQFNNQNNVLSASQNIDNNLPTEMYTAYQNQKQMAVQQLLPGAATSTAQSVNSENLNGHPENNISQNVDETLSELLHLADFVAAAPILEDKNNNYQNQLQTDSQSYSQSDSAESSDLSANTSKSVESPFYLDLSSNRWLNTNYNISSSNAVVSSSSSGEEQQHIDICNTDSDSEGRINIYSSISEVAEGGECSMASNSFYGVCRYVKDGCNQVILEEQYLAEHEKICTFQPTSCPLQCNWWSNLNNLHSHVSEAHSTNIFSRNPESFELPLSKVRNFTQIYFFQSVRDHIFITTVKSGECHIYVITQYLKQNADDNLLSYATLKIVDKHFMARTWKGEIDPYYGSQLMDLRSKGSLLVLDLDSSPEYSFILEVEIIF